VAHAPILESVTRVPVTVGPSLKLFPDAFLDIRSDLYSLGITLWEMMTGKTPFRGTPGEVMYQHQHSPLPMEELEGVPQPLVVLLEVLLEKDPGQRFQDPGELLKAMPTITARIEEGRKITREGLHKMPLAASRAEARKPPARQGPKKISVARLPVTGSDLFGREEDIAFLDRAWAEKDGNVVTIVAWGGAGKSTLVNHWLRRMAAEHYRSAQLVFGWSFYRQGTSGQTSSADEFLETSFQAAIRIAKEQKSVSLEKRAEATYTEYRHQKASGSAGRAFRLPL
jgi:hypothetical protein